jgi:hypothetical protein
MWVEQEQSAAHWCVLDRCFIEENKYFNSNVFKSSFWTTIHMGLAWKGAPQGKRLSDPTVMHAVQAHPKGVEIQPTFDDGYFVCIAIVLNDEPRLVRNGGALNAVHMPGACL